MWRITDAPEGFCGMIRLRMLGTVDLKDSQGREIQPVLRRAKLLALLGYLAAARPAGLHRRDTLIALLQQAAAAGNSTGAVRWAVRVTEISPFDETAVRRLIELLDRGGDRAGAVRAYEEFERRLDRDLGVQPSPETSALVGSIRTRRPSAQPAAAEAMIHTTAEAGRPDALRFPPNTTSSHWRRKVLPAFALLALLVIGVWLTGIPSALWARYDGIPSLRARIAAGDWEGANQLAARLEA